jgi:glucose-6-phosphate 1-dehydrogenase
MDDPGGMMLGEAAGKARPAPSCDLVIFGAGGDLTHRLLMPAIYNLHLAGLLPEDFRIIGVDARDLSDDGFRAGLAEPMRHFVTERRGDAQGALDEEKWAWLSSRCTYVRGDFADAALFSNLAGRIPHGRSAVFYLATAARFFDTIAEQLSQAGMMQEGPDAFRRLVVEKPFGRDLTSAVELNRKLLGLVEESQIYRIDHYLGKETVQNIMALRFSNGIFEPIWTRDNIDHVQITAAETVGVEARGKFYEGTGALRDMMPNHMFQLLSMVAMEAPTSFDADAVRNEKVKVVQAIHPLSGRAAVGNLVRGQYRAGAGLAGYRQEPDVDRNSSTETYVAMKLAIDNWRWAGVPFYLRTGKRLASRRTEIAIHFKVLQIQPSEGVSLQFSAKRPGPRVKLGGVRMQFNYADYFHEGPSTGYETLLYDCLIGDATLFQRADNVEAGWAVVQPALESWEAGHIHVHPYEAGSEGPEAADELLARDGRGWLPIHP